MYRYALAFMVGWFCGLLAGPYLPLLWIGVAVFGIASRKSMYQLIVLVGCSASLLGMVRMSHHTTIVWPETMQLATTQVFVRDQKITWEYQQLIVADQADVRYLVKLPLQPTYIRGSSLWLTATIIPWKHPYIPYHQQLQRQRIVGELQGVVIHQIDQHLSIIGYIESPRRYFLQQIHTTFPEPIASVVAGMLLGVAGDVDAQTASAFRQSGTSHILVISGWNITIVAALCLAFINILQPPHIVRLVFPLSVILLYVVFTGASAAVVRAGVMGSIIVIGKWLDRPRSMLYIIAVAIWMITVVDPAALWDVGMQLSTVATIGLVGFATPLERLLARTILRSEHLGWAREGLASTIAAQITTFPIMLCRLEMPTIWSLLANTIITPVVPLAMACGSLFLVATLIHPSIAQLMAWIAYPSFAWIVTGSQVLAQWPTPPTIPLSFEAAWIELCLHGCWLIGWYVWYRFDTSTSSPTQSQ